MHFCIGKFDFFLATLAEIECMAHVSDQTYLELDPHDWSCQTGLFVLHVGLSKQPIKNSLNQFSKSNKMSNCPNLYTVGM